MPCVPVAPPPAPAPNYVHDLPTLCTLTHDSVKSAILCRIIVNQSLITAIVDTGASHSCISSDFYYSSCAFPAVPLQPSPSFAAVDAQSNPMSSLGFVVLPVTFPNEEWEAQCKWQVLHKLPYQAILGVDFLATFGATIDLLKSRLTLPQLSPTTSSLHVPIWWFASDTTTDDYYVLHTTESMLLPPNSSVVAYCTIPATQVPCNLADLQGTFTAL